VSTVDVKEACSTNLRYTLGVFVVKAKGSLVKTHVAFSLSGEPPVPRAVCELGDEFVQPPPPSTRRRRIIRNESPEAPHGPAGPPVSAQSSRNSDKPRKSRIAKVSCPLKVDPCIETLTLDRDAALADADNARAEASLSKAAVRELSLQLEKVLCQCCEAVLTVFLHER